ncbi:hypothetical protein [Legionella sp. km772]|uniref:hypothetical protein n=1 Tax=Legionella sp. km772 TaxID=2498111 RepID=UPI000F8F289A|nr:hypothetical protein [Legionella sp. km772]RUR04846.1 hypothetical protein ELY15_15050 [Legionella sp. km772]
MVAASEYTLSYQLNKEEKIFYGPAGDFMSIACLTAKDGQKLLVWEEACSGTVCSDDGVYGVFDPLTKKLLLEYKPPSFEHYKGKHLDRYIVNKLRESEAENHKKAAELLGYEPPILFDYEQSFCCSSQEN